MYVVKFNPLNEFKCKMYKFWRLLKFRTTKVCYLIFRFTILPDTRKHRSLSKFLYTNALPSYYVSFYIKFREIMYHLFYCFFLEWLWLPQPWKRNHIRNFLKRKQNMKETPPEISLVLSSESIAVAHIYIPRSSIMRALFRQKQGKATPSSCTTRTRSWTVQIRNQKLSSAFFSIT